LLREARTGEDDRVDLEALKHRRELFEQLRAAAGVLALAGRPGDRRSLFGAVLGDRVDVGLTLLDSGDGDVGVFCRFLGLLESGLLIRFEPLLDRELVARLDVERVVKAELILARAGDDLPPTRNRLANL